MVRKSFHADPDPTFYFVADLFPDPTFYFDADPDLDPTFFFDADLDPTFFSDLPLNWTKLKMDVLSLHNVTAARF